MIQLRHSGKDDMKNTRKVEFKYFAKFNEKIIFR